jgi:hypothetical protein
MGLMCKCTPEMRTPFCGKPGCEWPAQRPEYLNGPVLTNLKFSGYASRLAQKSAAWAADTITCLPENVDKPIHKDAVARYLAEMRLILDHIEQQVKP